MLSSYTCDVTFKSQVDQPIDYDMGMRDIAGTTAFGGTLTSEDSREP